MVTPVFLSYEECTLSDRALPPRLARSVDDVSTAVGSDRSADLSDGWSDDGSRSLLGYCDDPDVLKQHSGSLVAILLDTTTRDTQPMKLLTLALQRRGHAVVVATAGLEPEWVAKTGAIIVHLDERRLGSSIEKRLNKCKIVQSLQDSECKVSMAVKPAMLVYTIPMRTVALRYERSSDVPAVLLDFKHVSASVRDYPERPRIQVSTPWEADIAASTLQQFWDSCIASGAWHAALAHRRSA